MERCVKVKIIIGKPGKSRSDTIREVKGVDFFWKLPTGYVRADGSKCCYHQHGGFVCTRESGHSGKHRADDAHYVQAWR